MTSRQDRIILSAIVLAALVLRVWGIGFGLPFQAHQDEPIVVNHALAYGSGDLNPHFFHIPPLTSYLLFLAYGVLFIAGKIAGAWGSAQDMALAFFRDPTVFYLTGRLFIGVIPGVICVILTCCLASRLLSERACLYASSVMALAFINVVNSHYIYTDMILLVFTLLAYSAFFRMYDRPSLANYCAAGVLVGLAAGTKYNGALLAATYILAHVLAVRKERRASMKAYLSGMFFAGGISAVIAFITVNPFALIDMRGFATSFCAQSGAFCYTGLGHHLLYSLGEGMSMPLALLGIAGLALLALAGDRGKILVSFPVIYYGVIVFRSQHFARYILPLVPFLAIGASYLVFHALPHAVRAPRLIKTITALAVIALVPTTVKSVKADILFSSKDTRIEAAVWIKKNLLPGSRLACDSTVFRPALKQPYSQLVEKSKYAANQPGLEALKSRKNELMLMAADKNDKGYPLYFLYEDPEVQGQFLDTLPALPYDIDALRREGIEYVVINGQVTNPSKEAFLKELGAQGSVAREFSPYFDGQFRQSLDEIDATCLPMAGQELFSRRSAGPALRVYRIGR